MALLQRMRSACAPSTKLAVRAFSSAPAAAEVPDSWRNPAAVLHGIDDIRFEDVPLPDTVADGHVRVQMRAVGICGSDVHYYKKVVHLDNICISCHVTRACRTHRPMSNPSAISPSGPGVSKYQMFDPVAVQNARYVY